jgi:hypothetical protein
MMSAASTRGRPRFFFTGATFRIDEIIQFVYMKIVGPTRCWKHQAGPSHRNLNERFQWLPIPLTQVVSLLHPLAQ